MPPKRNRPGSNRAASQNELTDTANYTTADRQVVGYKDAALHLLGAGLLPAPNVVALRSMWAAGGRSRRAAQLIADRWELGT